MKLEERSKLMERMMAKGIGFRDIEEFVLKEKIKGGHIKRGYEGIVDHLMKEKI